MRDNKVLIVGFDAAEVRQISGWLAREQFAVVTADGWRSGLRELYGQRPQALVLLSDAANPVPWSEVQLIRGLGDFAIVVVADQATRAALQKALDLGLAGYLCRPLEPRRLLDRLGFALQRLQSGRTAPMADFRHDGLAIDWKRFEVRRDGKPVRLSPIEFRLLSLLVERQDEVVTYGEILARVWGSNYDLTERRNVKLYIWYLRQKLERDPAHPHWIVTKPGVGYMFAVSPPADVSGTKDAAAGVFAIAKRDGVPRRLASVSSA